MGSAYLRLESEGSQAHENSEGNQPVELMSGFCRSWWEKARHTGLV